MSELRKNEIRFIGRLQISTAIGALAHTGANPDAQERLQSVLDAHNLLSDDVAQGDLSYMYAGKVAERDKVDIVDSLHGVAGDETVSSEERIAASALLELLQ